MGSCLSSRSSTDETYRCGRDLDSNIIGQTRRSICQLYDASNQLLASGTVVWFLTSGSDNSPIYGIVSHYVDAPLKYITVGEGISVVISEAVTFACPIMEVTFIQLEQEAVNSLKQHNCYFFDLKQPVQAMEAKEAIFVVGNPASSDTSSLHGCSGDFIEYYGLEIRYSMEDCSSLSSGLPLVSETGQLIGIYKGETNKPKEHLGLSITTIANSLNQLYVSNRLQTSVLSNPIDLSTYETNLKEIGLEMMSDRSNCSRYKSCNLYVSPPEKYITPIWFAPTCIGWYWTPTDPDGEERTNWMSVDKLAVTGGQWNGEIAAPKNTKIIRWLNKNNISYSK